MQIRTRSATCSITSRSATATWSSATAPAWKETDHDTALAQLQALAGELERSHPGAAASLREGMAETLTVTRLRVKGKLKKTLESTNPCESMIECVRRSSRNVKHWQNGEMCLR